MAREKDSNGSIMDDGLMCSTLYWITLDITQTENVSTWMGLQKVEPNCSRIELLDSVWWIYFRTAQQVLRRKDINMEKS
jgi:hypothetical protein